MWRGFEPARQIPIDYWLSRSDGHVLNTPELVLAHYLQ